MDICASFPLVTPGKSQTTKLEFKSLKKTTHLLNSTKPKGLNFVQLQPDSNKLALTAEASFANEQKMKSHLGYLLLMVRENDR